MKCGWKLWKKQINEPHDKIFWRSHNSPFRIFIRLIIFHFNDFFCEEICRKLVPFEERIYSSQRKNNNRAWWELFGVCVNIANGFDGMKNYILVFTLLQRCFCYLHWHTCSLSKHWNTGLYSIAHKHSSCTHTHTHTHTHSCKQTHQNAHRHTHTDHLTGKALACYLCWHVFKVYVIVCIPVPVFVSLVFPCQSPPWQ